MTRAASFFITLVGCIVAAAEPSGAQATPITYTMRDQGAAYQNGFTLQGTITTDGALGAIGIADFLSASYGDAGTQQVYTAAYFSWYTGGGAQDAPVTLFATATALTESPSQNSDDSAVAVGLTIINDNNRNDMWWYNTRRVGETYIAEQTIISPNNYYAGDGLGWNDATRADYNSPMPPDFGVGQTWVIATVVPEPGSFALCMLGLTLLVGFALRGRRWPSSQVLP